MLRVYVRYVALLRVLRRFIEAIERRDVSLGKQLRDCASSVALNLNEGSGSEAGTRRQRYLTALGSAREVCACLDVAEALGYIEPAPESLRRELGEVIAVLVKLAVGRPAVVQAR